VPPTPTPKPRELTAPAPGCEIKGVVSTNGDKVYYKPGLQGYDRLVVNPAAGGRWLCTEDEARAAGWRAPRQ
jgi:hypothetical protein